MGTGAGVSVGANAGVGTRADAGPGVHPNPGGGRGLPADGVLGSDAAGAASVAALCSCWFPGRHDVCGGAGRWSSSALRGRFSE